jgi:hypothetical protein
LPVGEFLFSAAVTSSDGTAKRPARVSSSRRTILGRPGTTGAAWKLDSCSMMAMAAQ